MWGQANMSYIWQSLLSAEKQGLNKNSINFTLGKVISPYMEVAFNELNAVTLPEDRNIEVNIYYRFYEIFKDLFKTDYFEDFEIREVLLDILLHFLGELDLKSGICKKELYKEFILNDIKLGVFGDSLKENIENFTKEELNIFLEGLLTLYSTGTSMLLFKKVLRGIFKGSSVYEDREDTKKIYIYLNSKKNRLLEGKFKAVLDMFMPINTKTLIFWDKHFGVIEAEAAMKIDNIVMVE